MIKVTEEDIKSYLSQFNVDRETAIQEIKELLEDYSNRQGQELQEVYNDIKRSSY